jgi:hypothetical protein
LEDLRWRDRRSEILWFKVSRDPPPSSAYDGVADPVRVDEQFELLAVFVTRRFSRGTAESHDPLRCDSNDQVHRGRRQNRQSNPFPSFFATSFVLSRGSELTRRKRTIQRGIIADFSSTSVPSVPSYNLGLAQLEEIQDAMLELKRVKTEKFGSGGTEGWRTIAWSDTFSSQGQYLLATSQSAPLFLLRSIDPRNGLT